MHSALHKYNVKTRKKKNEKEKQTKFNALPAILNFYIYFKKTCQY